MGQADSTRTGSLFGTGVCDLPGRGVWNRVDGRIKSDHDETWYMKEEFVKGGMDAAWVYIMTNRPNGTLYVGVTTDLIKRAWEHRESVVEGFTKTHGLTRLVYFEEHASVVEAIRREKAIKRWLRAWKARLILENNPGWVDLYPGLLG